jgi:hypothetical protein
MSCGRRPTNTHPRSRPFVSAAAAAAGLLAALALLAACGSSSSGNAAPGAQREEARTFAQCIRDNGVPDFPDPDASGRFSGAGHEQQDNPKYQTAQQKCRNLAPGGEHENLGDPAYVEQARKFAQCIRDNGVPDFPDPDASGRFSGAGHEQQDNPKFKAAQEKCRQTLPGGGDHQ